MRMSASKSLRYLLFSTAFLLFSCLHAFAQTDAPERGKAVVGKEGKVVIQPAPLQYDNVVDLSSLDQSARQQAKTRFAGKNTDLVTFVVDETTGEIHVQIELRARPDWTVDDWNHYLSTL